MPVLGLQITNILGYVAAFVAGAMVVVTAGLPIFTAGTTNLADVRALSEQTGKLILIDPAILHHNNSFGFLHYHTIMS